MRYWVYKCNTQMRTGGPYAGDWEVVFGQSTAIEWGRVRDNAQLGLPKKSDRILCYQTNRRELVGTCTVQGFNRQTGLLLKPTQLLRAAMPALKKKYARIGSIPAFQPGRIRTIYEITNADARSLVATASRDPMAGNRVKVRRPTDDAEALESRATVLRKRGAIPKPAGQTSPASTTRKVIAYVRDPEVVAWVQINAKGKCEACGARAPFTGRNGLPFLEVHHVRQLARRGPDTTNNAVAVCPNCHRALHLARNAAARKKALVRSVARLRQRRARRLPGPR